MLPYEMLCREDTKADGIVHIARPQDYLEAKTRKKEDVDLHKAG